MQLASIVLVQPTDERSVIVFCSMIPVNYARGREVLNKPERPTQAGLYGYAFITRTSGSTRGLSLGLSRTCTRPAVNVPECRASALMNMESTPLAWLVVGVAEAVATGLAIGWDWLGVTSTTAPCA